MKLFLVALLIPSILFAKTIKVETQQEKVEVFVKNSDTKKYVKIGVTPLKMSFSDIADNYAKSENFMMVLKKGSYNDYRVMVSKLNSGTYEINANLTSTISGVRNKEYDKLITDLFDVQRLVRSKNYPDAIKKLDKLEEKHPDISSVYEMKAMTYYMNKDLSKSLSFYRKAASVNPSNREVYTMKKYLEKELGASKGAN